MSAVETSFFSQPQIKIGDIWSFDDWQLYLAQSPELEAAQPTVIMVNIPAGDGALDMSEALANRPIYNNRLLKFTLIVTQPEREWDEIRRTVENYCNGKRMRIVTPYDPYRYLFGRISSIIMRRDRGMAYLDFEVQCDPWRYKHEVTSISVSYVGGNVAQHGVLKNERMWVLPTITTDAPVSITINGVTESIDAGTYKFTSFFLQEGDTPYTIEGPTTANVKIEYQEGSF